MALSHTEIYMTEQYGKVVDFSRVTLRCLSHISAGRLRAERFVRVWLSIEYTSGLRRLLPQALTLLGGVRFIAWRLRCPKKGNTDGSRATF